MTGSGRSETVTGDGRAVIAQRRMSAHIRPQADDDECPLPGTHIRASRMPLESEP